MQVINSGTSTLESINHLNLQLGDLQQKKQNLENIMFYNQNISQSD